MSVCVKKALEPIDRSGGFAPSFGVLTRSWPDDLGSDAMCRVGAPHRSGADPKTTEACGQASVRVEATLLIWFSFPATGHDRAEGGYSSS